MPAERADVVVVGARCAGAAVAVPLARAGHRVVVLDRAAFPSDTLSTHVSTPSAVAELQRLGALEAILALGPAVNDRMSFQDEEADLQIRERFRPIDGIDYALSIPRLLQDEQLVAATRRAGADVRERSTVHELLWRGGRAAGVRYRDAGGREHELRAALVVGADGRGSRVAAAAGAWEPYRGSQNGRGFAFRTLVDPLAGTPLGREIAIFSAHGTMALVAPSCPEGETVVTLACPAGDIGAFRRDPEGAWRGRLAADPALTRRFAGGGAALTKVRSIASLPAYYRRSSGPGWALAGDAGHFKDPIAGNGQRDALHHGRRLGEAVPGDLEDPRRLDAALRRWERERDRDTISTYHWGNRAFWTEPLSPLTRELLRTYAGSEDPDLTDTFNHTRPAEAVMGPAHIARALVAVLRTPGADRRALLREVRRELPQELQLRRHRRLDGFRSTRPVATERPGWTVGPPPRPPAG
jgi:2-polyprenyl-6-methoxyphenol hydroxylase-like FAD-dependent oxidoreductase